MWFWQNNPQCGCGTWPDAKQCYLYCLEDDSFQITALPEVFYSSNTTAILRHKKKQNCNNGDLHLVLWNVHEMLLYCIMCRTLVSSF